MALSPPACDGAGERTRGEAGTKHGERLRIGNVEGAADEAATAAGKVMGEEEQNGIESEVLVVRHVLDLDTGELQWLEDTVDENQSWQSRYSFDHLSGTKKPWQKWWRQKQRRDQRLWTAAASGALVDLQRALARPQDGSAPAQINAVSPDGRNALHIAACAGNEECARCILDFGSDIDACTEHGDGASALHLASRLGYVPIVQLLLQRGANPCSKDTNGNLAIHHAAAHGQTSVVALLLDCGSDSQLSTRNLSGQTPQEVSVDIRTCDLLRQHRGATSRPSAEGCARDWYTDRTPFEGEVLLHNARSDAVRRLLSGNGIAGTQSPETSLEGMPPPPRKNRSRLVLDAGVRKRRPAFVRVRTNGPSTMEQAGPADFVVEKQIGKGSYGEVFKVVHRKDGQIFAMKILKKSKVCGNHLRYTMSERNILSYTKHPYIVSLHHAFQNDSHLALVMHFCPGGNLQTFVTRQKRLLEPVACIYSAEVLLALCHLHARNIVFRDLKPANVVIDEDGHAMLTDFGLAKEGVATLHGATTFCGSAAYLAPEIVDRRGHGHAVDIYALGVLHFVMLTGRPPFYHRDRETLFINIRYAILHVPAFVSAPSSSFIRQTMERDPSKRLGAGCTVDLQQHSLFAQIDFHALLRREIPVPSGEGLGGEVQDSVVRCSTFRGCTAVNVEGDRSGHQTFGVDSQTSLLSAAGKVFGWEFASTAKPKALLVGAFGG